MRWLNSLVINVTLELLLHNFMDLRYKEKNTKIQKQMTKKKLFHFKKIKKFFLNIKITIYWIDLGNLGLTQQTRYPGYRFYWI